MVWFLLEALRGTRRGHPRRFTHLQPGKNAMFRGLSNTLVYLAVSGLVATSSVAVMGKVNHSIRSQFARASHALVGAHAPFVLGDPSIGPRTESDPAAAEKRDTCVPDFDESLLGREESKERDPSALSSHLEHMEDLGRMVTQRLKGSQ